MSAPTTTGSTVQIPRPGRYEIDAQVSTVRFTGRHLFGLAPVRGTFAIRHGVIDVADPVDDSRVEAEIDTASFHTGNTQRDANVRSRRLLDADRHPVMTFTSGRLDRSDAGTTLAGTLTVRDVQRPVSLRIDSSALQPGRPYSFAARAVTRIDRADFGVTAYRGLAGRHLELSVQILAVAL